MKKLFPHKKAPLQVPLCVEALLIPWGEPLRQDATPFYILSQRFS